MEFTGRYITEYYIYSHYLENMKQMPYQ